MTYYPEVIYYFYVSGLNPKKLVNMKNILVFIFSLFLLESAEAQLIDPKIAAKRAAERRANRKMEDGIDKGLGKAEEGIEGIFKKKKKNVEEEEGGGSKSKKKSTSLEDDEEGSTSGGSLEEEGDNEINFVRGSKILYQDDFAKDAVGDFPAKWNTNGSGEVKKLRGFEEKYLKVPGGSIINLEMTKPLPSNFTIELDVIIPEGPEHILAGIGLANKPDYIDYQLGSPDIFSVQFATQASNREWDRIAYGRNIGQDYTLKKINYSVPLNEKIHVGIMVNNQQRIRVYVDGKKRIDMPKGFKPELAKSFFVNGIVSGHTETKNGYFYVSNILIAEAGTDRRSSVQKDLIEKGTFTTSDILFATNSDKIQTSSFKILKEIGEAMESAPSVKFMITGHTDSDGDEAANQTLSEKRALAVKNYLIENFDVKSASLKTSGKGESEPVASNKTTDGKAQNRRVQFVKL